MLVRGITFDENNVPPWAVKKLSLVGNGRCPVPYRVARPFEMSSRLPQGTPQRALPTA